MAGLTREQRAAKEARLAEQVQAAAPEFNMADITAMIRESRDTIAALRQELADVKSSQPRMVPREKTVDPNTTRRTAINALVKGQQSGGSIASVPTDSQGQMVGPGHGQPLYRDRAQIRIRADVAREGFPKAGDPFPVKYDIDLRGHKRVSRDWAMMSRIFPGREENGDVYPRDMVWGDILTANRCSGEGSITYTGMMTRMGVWKYRAKVPGLTQETGDSFYEFELEAA
jgi:hypothetical protein